MRKIVALIMFLGIYLNAFSQNTVELIDKLKIELKSSPDPKRTAMIFSELTWYYNDISSDSALAYGKKAIIITKKINDEKLLSQIYSDLGAVYFRKGSFKESKFNYLCALKLRSKNKDYDGVAKTNINLANILASNQNYTESINYYLKAITYFDKKNDTINSQIKANVAMVFLEMKNLPEAKKFIIESIAFQKDSRNDEELLKSYLTLGNIFSEEKNYDQATYYYNLCLSISLKLKNNQGAMNAYHDLGSLNLDFGHYEKALFYFEKSKKYVDFTGSDLDKAVFEINIGRCYLVNKKYSEAAKILLKNKKTFEDNDYKVELLNTYKWLSQSYSYLKQPDSSDYYFQKYEKLSYRILNDKNLKQTTELETKYQTAKKEKLIAEQEAENKRKTLLNIIIAIIALFIALSGFLIYRQQKLKNKQQLQEFQLKTAISQIETQNKLHEQRLSISRDLHDNIGAQLTFVISSIDNLKFGNKITDNTINRQLNKISDFTKATIIELRDTIWAMNSSEFTMDDFYARIVNFIEKAKSSKDDLTFKFHISDDLKDAKFSSVIGINLYRTIQEAINNAIKYSAAKNIMVDFSKENNEVKIEIKDDGNGFDLATLQYGNGLYNMKKRIDEVGGIYEINSKINEGTTITILLPKTKLS